jgi:AcrR family transcriptional regulator
MNAPVAPPKRVRGRREGSLTRQNWIDAAREVLISEGIERVKVEPLAEKLKVSRGSFYWHFVDRQALLDALLALWEETALEPMRAVAGERDLTPVARYEKFMRVWVQGEPYCPIYDLSIRRWAMVAPEVSRVVKKADDARVKLLTGIFKDMGHDADEAFIRARITYFHQIGYYATDVQESTRTRERYWPLYVKILAGR